MAVRYSTLPTGTGFSNVDGSRAMKLGRVCDAALAQVKASSKADFKRKPPKIMKLWRLRYCGCMIWTLWILVWSMNMAVSGLRAGVLGSKGVLADVELWERRQLAVIVYLLQPQCVNEV